MECPHCAHTFFLGDDSCDNCGADLTQVALPKPKNGKIHELILEDPISQLNAPEPIVLKPTDPARKALESMKKLRFGSVLVVDGKCLVGIFTEHDLLRHFAGKEADLDQVPLSDVMTERPQTLHEDDTLSHALNRMAVGGYRHIPVIRDGEPVGFISIRGILRYIAENALAE